MSETTTNLSTRREFILNTGRLAAVSALASAAVPYVHAAGNETIQLALVGCGGRGGGAAANALSVKRGEMKLVAMADVFPERLRGSFDNLKKQHAAKMAFRGGLSRRRAGTRESCGTIRRRRASRWRSRDRARRRYMFPPRRRGV